MNLPTGALSGPGLGEGILPERLTFSNLFRHLINVLARRVMHAATQTNAHKTRAVSRTHCKWFLTVLPAIEISSIEKFLQQFVVVHFDVTVSDPTPGTRQADDSNPIFVFRSSRFLLHTSFICPSFTR